MNKKCKRAGYTGTFICSPGMLGTSEFSADDGHIGKYIMIRNIQAGFLINTAIVYYALHMNLKQIKRGAERGGRDMKV
jgi:hypothetical protein